ncbi:MAG: GNAT family N-acetyltransferase, partial [Pseudomonadota bacterium]
MQSTNTRSASPGRPFPHSEQSSHLGPYAVRKLWPSETKAFHNHLCRLDQDALRKRFAHSVSSEFIKDYAQNMCRDGAIMYGAFDDDGFLRAVAELRKIGPGWSPEAEAAFSVEADHQGHGLGTRLMGLLIRSARNRGVEHLYMSCLAENAMMQRVAKHHDAILKFEYGSVVGDITPQPSDLFSQLAESVDDRVGLLLAV